MLITRQDLGKYLTVDLGRAMFIREQSEFGKNVKTFHVFFFCKTIAEVIEKKLAKSFLHM